MTMTLRESTSTPIGRTSSLARAEWLQFIRNRTLMIMMIFPALLGVGMFGLLSGTSGELSAAGSAMEIITLTTLMFVLYYSVLSMATTRRDERVLKRLRTGEASDREILVSLAVPGFLATIVLVAVTSLIIWIMGAPAPVNVVLIIAAVVLGAVVAWGLALLTSTITQNAEAAQMTSMPVIILAVLSQASIRAIFPEGVQRVVDLTPFAAAADLAHLGWTGLDFVGAAGGAQPLGFGETFAEGWQPLLVLALWAIVCGSAGIRYMKWDNRA